MKCLLWFAYISTSIQDEFNKSNGKQMGETQPFLTPRASSNFFFWNETSSNWRETCLLIQTLPRSVIFIYCFCCLLISLKNIYCYSSSSSIHIYKTQHKTLHYYKTYNRIFYIVMREHCPWWWILISNQHQVSLQENAYITDDRFFSYFFVNNLLRGTNDET